MIEKIKAEVEKRLKLYDPDYVSAGKELKRILFFIESLEQKSQCDGCVNDKGCVTCVDGNMKETQPKGFDEAYLQEKIDLAKKNGSWREGLEKESEVDLEKEVELWYDEYAGNKRFDWLGFARHFYELGLSQKESLEQEQFADETMMEKDKIDTGFTKFMEKGVEVTDFCKPVPEEIAKVLPDVVSECLLGDEKGKSEILTIKGWVARDKDGSIELFLEKPYRGETVWYPQPATEHNYLSNDSFQDLRWEDEPIEVELILKRI